MIAFVFIHPYLSSFAAFWLAVVIVGWLFVAGASITSGRDEHEFLETEDGE